MTKESIACRFSHDGPTPQQDASNDRGVPTQISHDLRMGHHVVLNSGGPAGLIVDLLAAEEVTVSWSLDGGAAQELNLPVVCLARVEPEERR
jgi:hypothetical protein